tara:strand:- start:75 stop:362 length:288 start_codon:yes stop_codon:yes gene_type:complete
MKFFSGESGSERAKATEIPPLRPPQVSRGIKLRGWEKISIGNDIEVNRAINIIGIEKITANKIGFVNDIPINSNPIIKNKTEFRTSSISDQNLKR